MFAKVRTYGSLVRFSHTIFAMPFALAAVALASAYEPITFRKVGLILLCIVSARTAAMAVNRLVDHDIDAKNPRTQTRELPQGVLKRAEVIALVIISSGVFVFGAALLGKLPLMLSPLALLLALGYSYTKRFTAWCHVVLGAAVAFAPGGAWIAMGAPLTLAPVYLVAAVALWVAGFDVLYSLQDQTFDAENALHSIPSRFGIKGSLFLSAMLHVGTVVCLGIVGVLLARGVFFAVGVFLVAAMLVYEHSLVRPSDLSKINKAFFDINGYVSVGFFIFVLLDTFRG